jgi:hypothetical protein
MAEERHAYFQMHVLQVQHAASSADREWLGLETALFKINSVTQSKCKSNPN